MSGKREERFPQDKNFAALFKELQGFKFVRVLGSGAFSHVVLATKNGRKMALKLFRKPDQHKPRAISEARVEHGLKHGNMVEVYGVLREPLCIVMEYCDEGNLWDRISDRSSQEILRLIIDTGIGIGKALWVIHRYGLVHLDIKPENILFKKEGNELVPKLSDFGVARLRGSFASMATPQYLPPAYPIPVEADPRLDLYQLCLSLYFVLATVTSRKAEMNYLQQLKENPIPIGNLWSGMPVEVDNILLKGVNVSGKDFSKAYQKAEDLVMDLNNSRFLIVSHK